MSSNKDAKSAAKALKKSQKSSKKQQQQQQQVQLRNDVAAKNVRNAATTTGTTATTMTTTSTPTPTAANSANYGVNRITGKTARAAGTANASAGVNSHNNNNNNNSLHHNNNNNNNNNTNNNNSAINNGGLLAGPKPPAGSPSTRSLPPGYEDAPKFERSNSFSLRGKLSKLINSITGSKENLARTPEDGDGLQPYKFTRSRSMIMLRRSNRRSLIEPQLEQLSEETEQRAGDPTSPASPRKNSLETAPPPEGRPPTSMMSMLVTSTATRTPSTTTATTATATTPKDFKTPRRPTSQPMTSTPLDMGGDATATSAGMRRKSSSVSLAAGVGNSGVPATFNPQLNFQKRRSNTLIASFKSTLSGITGGGEKKKEKLNPKWSASLQSLQAIDNMVSYENMSFIDYDKFNGYEKQLEKQLSTLSLSQSTSSATMGVAAPPMATATATAAPMTSAPTTLPAKSSPVPPHESTPQPVAPTTPTTVVRRRRTRSSRPVSGTGSGSGSGLEREDGSQQRNSYAFDTDYEHNLDKPKNLYRYSLDSRKLELLNEITRNSFVWDKHLVDVLNLEDGSVGRRRTARCPHSHTHKQTPSRMRPRDVVDGAPVVQLKSKSLTHLDGLDSVIACQQQPASSKTAVSSSEYFSVSFCTENGCQEEEFIPATKGVTLSTALNQALRRRNLSFSQINITDNNLPSFLEAGTASYASSLDENTEVENLAGRHLIVTERDGSRKTLQKAASFGSRARPPRLLSSASTEETTEAADQRIVPGKQLKQRWSGLFGIKNPQQSQLCELLNNYAKLGVPQRTPAAAHSFDHPDFDAAQEYLDNMHASWRDFVQCEGMSDSETRIQTAIWELVTTEVCYIHALQTVTDLFLACLEAVQEEKLLTDVDQHRLFSNVRDICEANLRFWTLYLYPMVASSVATRDPMRIEFFQPGFNTFATIFAPYKKYCAEQSTCQFYCKELNRTNALFTSYLAWCESQKMCNRLRLADILVRPMQRLTKYSLLLAAIKKHMADVEEIEAVDSMIHTVENFVCSVNNHLTTRQENERLKGVMARIESYDVVDTNNELLDKLVKQYSQMFDLCAPMKGCPAHQVRHLFMEGDHKFKDHLGKADVHCFLLTDMLLVCKTIAKKGLGALKVIRQPYLTDRLMVHHNNNNILNCVYLNEFQVAVTAFTLQCSEAKNWYESLKRAKLIYTRLKQGGANSWDGFRFGGSTGGGGGGSGGGGGGGGSFGASGATADSLGVKKSPMNSSLCSHVSSANNSHSGSVEWNDSRNISVDFEKTNSLSSDEGSSLMGASHAFPFGKGKGGGVGVGVLATSPHKLKVMPAALAAAATASSANTLSVQPVNHLGQSLPNLNLHHNQTNNTLLVPGTTSSHSGNLLLSPSHRGISYPPPSPTRVPLRRGMAFSASIKNPPLVKTRNITSQNSINWHQIPATPTPTSPQTSQQSSPSNSATKISNTGQGGGGGGGISPTTTLAGDASAGPAGSGPGSGSTSIFYLSSNSLAGSNSQLQSSNETDV